MNPNNIGLKSKIFSGLIWKFLEQNASLLITFIVQIILARLLSPRDYGLLALIIVFITISQVFVNSGFGSALIQKQKVDEIDYSSVFYLSLFISLGLYLGIFFTAPIIASFYDDTNLISILRVQAITLIFSALNIVQYAVLTRGMKFKKSFFSSLVGVICSGFIGILMAYKGFGVWALVFSNLTSNVISTIVLWSVVKWRPKLLFSIKRIKGLFSYSSKILISGIIEVISNNLSLLVIGKVFNKEILGYYNRGQNIPNLVATNINGPITSVIFPALSLCQNDKKQVKSIVKRSVTTSSFIVFPVMIGLAATAEPLTVILLTEKWLPSVIFMQISAITFSFWPLHTANVEAIGAIGRSDISLKLQVIKKTFLVVVLLISIPFGAYAIILGSALISFVSTFINAWPNKRLINYGIREQWGDILPSLLLSIIMGIIVYSIKFLMLNVWITILSQIIIGALIYIAGSYVFKLKSLIYLVSLFNKRRIKLNNRT
ncbi:lipopolysaccharide biosynthesis protein [Neobacillus sp. NPDC093127]|uniref:lipopolysaccharide biosynthesis protein n=1 Tax=Neobacillus sp. NPDC093127 TaxID=3364296 RepID=UPI0037F9522A